MLRAMSQVLLAALLLSSATLADEQASSPASRFRVPEGFVVEQVAGPPLVRYPLFACFDDAGRLYVAEGTGTNLPGPELVPKKLSRITRLEDTDGDGVFDDARTFADQLVFAQGVLWHEGAVYCCSHPSIWKLWDEDGDGVSERREELVTKFNFNGNGCDIHGPFLGPDGWLYWTDGRHGYRIEQHDGGVCEGFAARIFRCRTDGTGLERIAGGGFDNPVEVAFTPDGELVGTMDQGPGDCLLHYVEGGVYPMEHGCLEEFPKTGPLLGAIRQYSAALPVALCGLARYRGPDWGAEYQDCLFSAQFNVHRIERHRLIRDGSTFRSEERDFVTSDDYNVHLSDVLEDADGSLLFIDMGAWFNYGCPTSKIARPEILGAIYRVRKTDAQPPADPWGREVRWDAQDPSALTARLGDSRPAVRDKAVATLTRRGADALESLAAVLETGTQSEEARRNALWTLCRIGSPEALAVARTALADPDLSVRLVAIQVVGRHRDGGATTALASLAIAGEAPQRRAAAEAVGRIGGSEAVAAIFESLRQGNLDRFLEHSLIYALLQIGDREATLPALADANPRVRRAALLALDQMPGGALTQEQVVPLADTDDLELRQAALDVMSRHAEWAASSGLLDRWLTASELSEIEARSLAGAILAFSDREAVQQAVADSLARSETPPATRSLLVETIGRVPATEVPAIWLDALGAALSSDDAALAHGAVAAIKVIGSDRFDAQLADLGRRTDLPLDLRVAAIECAAPRAGLDQPAFDLLLGQLSEEAAPILQVAAARTLGASAIDDPHLHVLAEQIAVAGPMIAPLLAPAFGRSRDAETGLALVEALERSPGAEALPPEDLDRLLRDYPPEVAARAQPLRQRLAARRQDQAAYLTGLLTDLLKQPGSAERGREVFFSQRAACAACHRVPGGQGNVGPDLSQVGRFRTTGDLLESVVFPSSSIVPHFRTYQIVTQDGRTVSGIVVRETADSLHSRTPQLAEVRLRRDEIESLAPSDVSVMPQGLEKQLTRQELSDLLEYLYRLR